MSRAGFFLGLAIVLVVAALGVISRAWTPYLPGTIDILHRMGPPSAAHLLGTDPFGRDVFSMIMTGAWDSLGVAALSVLLGTLIGLPLGMIAASWRGLPEEAIMRGADLAFAFPAVLTAVMLTALRGPGATTEIIAIGLFSAPVIARTTRAAAGAIWVRDFTRAARALGRSRPAIAWHHVLPNILGLVTVQVTLQLSLAVLAEAGLSYLGLGVPPPAPSWGRMLGDAQTYIYTAPMLAVFPGLAIALTVLGLNLLGDGLRDRMDRRGRRRAA